MARAWLGLIAPLALGGCAPGTISPSPALTADGSRIIPLTAPANHQAILTEAVFAPGQTIAAHRHAGVEIVYGIDGETKLQMEGQPWRTIRAGQSATIPAGTYHRAEAGPAGARVLILRVHPAGQPLRIGPDRPVRFPE